MPRGPAGFGGLAANVLLDAVERGDLFQPFVGDRRGAGSGDLMQLAARMRPTVGQFDILRWPFEQPVVARIAIDLQGAGEAFEDIFCILPRAARRISESHAGRVFPTPGAIVASERPEVSGLGLSPSRIEQRSCGFVHEQLGGSLQIGKQRVVDRLEFECRPSDPGRQRRAVEIDALAAVNLGLTVERQMIGVF